MKKTLIISWDIYPTMTAAGILIKNIFDKDNEDYIFAGENYDNIKKERYYYFKPLFGKIPKLWKYLKWLSLISIFWKLTRIHKKEKFENVIVVFPDEFYLFLAYLMKKFIGTNYYTWFHNSYSHNRSGLLGILARIIEPKIVKNAVCNFSISDGLTKVLKDKYQNIEFETVLHGFNSNEIHQTKVKKDLKRDVKFVYTGTLNASVLDASLRMCRHIIKNKNYTLHVYGKNKYLFEKNGLVSDNIIYHGFVDDDVFYKELPNYDIAIIPLGLKGSLSETEYKTIFPTRLIPIFMTGIPILANVPKNSYLYEFLNQFGLGKITTTESEEELEVALNKLIGDYELRSQCSKNLMNLTSMFDSDAVHNRIKNLISKQ